MERSQIKQHLADPEFFAENRLRPVSDHMWYETEKEALKKEKMRLRMSLGGAWKFFYAPNPDSVPDGFERNDYSCDGWNTISVPAHMELQGYGRPHYTDTDYPWDGIEEVTPHGIPQIYNPTGCYVRYFSIPEQMKKKKLLLTFEGVETAFHCWINGHYVGYGEDSYTPSVFEITPFVENGENKQQICAGRNYNDSGTGGRTEMKVAVIGYSGCGKSMIAAWIAKKNQLPLLYLDTVHWLPGWKERPQDEKEQMMKDFLDSHDSWVIDGNYHSLEYERRMREADQILFLDFPRLVCLYRAWTRSRRYRGRTRESMTEGCPEKLDLGFVLWILRDGRTRKKKAEYQRILDEYKTKVVHITNQRELDEERRKWRKH